MHDARGVWRCKGCGARTSVRAGTVMHKTQMPLGRWFWAAYVVATHDPGISAVRLARQFGIRRHETAWMMLHKLRRAMVAPEREPLKGEVEVDEFYLGGLEERVPGRERVKQTLVGVAIEVRGRGSGRLRLRVLADVSRHSLLAFVQSAVSVDAIVHTDRCKGYDRLSSLGYQHRPRWQTTAPSGEQLLPRAHRAVSNLKAWLHGTHRWASREHLPVYLDEYVFRHNRRGNPRSSGARSRAAGQLTLIRSTVAASAAKEASGESARRTRRRDRDAPTAAISPRQWTWAILAGRGSPPSAGERWRVARSTWRIRAPVWLTALPGRAGPAARGWGGV
jgi:hypothetical protein